MTFSPYVLGTGIAGWNFLDRTRVQQQQIFEKSPILDRAVQDFTQKIEGIQSSDQLLDDYNVLKVALGAFGLDEDINNRAFIKKVLDSDLSEPTSFANRLNDNRYLGLAQTFGFGGDAGPQLPSSSVEKPYANVASPEDLLSNQTLLNQALDDFGLEKYAGNEFFLMRVLESDTTDPASFVNRLSDSKLADFANAFQFNQPPDYASSMEALVGEFSAMNDGNGPANADELLENEDLLKAVVDSFDLEYTNTIFLKRMLESNPYDPDSPVNQQEDPRYLAMSRAFGFGISDINSFTSPEELLAQPQLLEDALEQFNLSNPGEQYIRDVLESDLSDPNSFVNQPSNIAFYDFAEAFQNEWPSAPSRMQVLANEVGGKLAGYEQPQQFVFDFDAFEAGLDVFNISERELDFDVMIKAFESDLSSEISYANLHRDPNLKAMAHAFAFNPGGSDHTYPAGFAQEIVDLYKDRNFEIAIGESDPNMRLALSLERELQSIADAGGSEDAHWFGIIGSPPLKSMFETALGLPASFGQLDVDRQVNEMKERAQTSFGTTHPADLLETEKLDEFRNRFLLLSGLNSDQAANGFSDPIFTLFQ
ncbi:DUF1217 domain-containing protein [Phaeobacter gallaeciensis]|uniref:Flagellar protein n=1 Tax=Phaeobacter gallaeciensis TaxID=60890 RepID=A0AAC9Z7Y8_9RHOB|nr:DUF1217 domain-containing protein [Phaeobacter gallaeciensis]AHD08800.1 hypothetical protein Gal_01026 [Phaeobacter gallaeciensis DSM 26640]ATE92066.1 hypothetical protein PhaeoP11_01021 [Phaeobacter gallaeciensis]ATE98110.1 hypothetical protein PhaeoP73_02823 [Phaeobacter gallaeciensis]ATF00682.1 hypothetical protein PhaeoP75_01022 [Phaeobacter gallaeciensis]ATF05113.1 hypothetical protein PhaeoP63_01021 [Phaeobacter gallaeciensis]